MCAALCIHNTQYHIVGVGFGGGSISDQQGVGFGGGSISDQRTEGFGRGSISDQWGVGFIGVYFGAAGDGF